LIWTISQLDDNVNYVLAGRGRTGMDSATAHSDNSHDAFHVIQDRREWLAVCCWVDMPCLGAPSATLAKSRASTTAQALQRYWHFVVFVKNEIYRSGMVTSTLFDMTGKTAYITGGTKGVGRAIANAFVDHGAAIVLTGRSHEEAERVAADIP
jgi:hypothetical protein